MFFQKLKFLLFSVFYSSFLLYLIRMYRAPSVSCSFFLFLLLKLYLWHITLLPCKSFHNLDSGQRWGAFCFFQYLFGSALSFPFYVFFSFFFWCMTLNISYEKFYFLGQHKQVFILCVALAFNLFDP